MVAKVDMVTDVRENFIRRSAQNAKRNVKFRSNQAVIVQSTAKTVIPKERLTGAKLFALINSDSFKSPTGLMLPGFLIKNGVQRNSLLNKGSIGQR